MIDQLPSSSRASPPQCQRRWPVVVVTALVTFAIIAGAAWFSLRHPAVRKSLLEQVSTPSDPWPVKHSAGLRRVLIDERDAAAARGDLRRVAEIHALFAQEALRRAARTQRAWMAQQHPKTRLFPEALDKPVFRYQNTPADFFGFMLQAGLRLNPDTLPAVLETLAAERAIVPKGGLCRDVAFDTGKDLGVSREESMFGSTEYVKDGLLSVYERYGDRPELAAVHRRMWEVLDAVVAKSQHATKFGNIPSGGAEDNGNVLQACSRLSFSAPKGQAYADMAGRLADAYVHQAMPKNHGLVPGTFDFAADKVTKPKVRLRDHGNEVIPGLAEAFAMAVAKRSESAWQARADAWAEPVARMFEILLTKGVYESGPFKGTLKAVIDPDTFVDNGVPNDNWAYVLNGAYLFTQAARQHGKLEPARLDALDATADRIAAAVATLHGIPWENEKMDGYADALEGGLYVANHRPAMAGVLLPWVDDQIALLFERQVESGMVNFNYLDGNFIRTALLYADARAGGWTVEPWREDIRVGFAQGPTGEACVIVQADHPYAGTLRPDHARHSEILKLPWDWPRLNSWPQWHLPTAQPSTIEPTAVAGTPTAEKVQEGFRLELRAGETAAFRWKGR